MMDDWIETTLGEAPIKIIDGDRGKNYPKRADFTEDGYCLFLNTKNVTSTGFVFSELNFIDKQRDELLRKGKLKRGDSVLTTRGTVGNVAYYDDQVPFDHMRINSGMVIIRPDGISERFNYLLFRSLQRSFHVYATGSAQPQLPIRDLIQVPIVLPPLEDQEAITAVLASLDDKIDLLHRQNKTLESLAQTLFRHWFIDNASDDWEDGTLGDLIELLYGKGLKSSIRTGVGYPVVGSSGIIDFHSEYLVEAPGIVIGRKGTLGEVIYLSDDFFPIDTTYFIRSKIHSPNLYFEYFLLKTINFKDMNTDSAVPGLNRNIALATEVAVPPQSEITKFNDLVQPLLEKIQRNNSQIRILEKLRDTLLPKLMNGEVRVRL